MQFEINTNTKPSFVKQVCKATLTGRSYFVYTLENEYLSNTDVANRYYRSVIQDAQTQTVLSVAPAKSLPYVDFINLYGTGDLQYGAGDLQISEIVEGTMVNLFYSEHMGGWEIATRNSVGCNYHYFRTQYDGIQAPQLTFKQMFLEAIGQSNLNNIQGLDTTVCYSFILQHPENHIVLNIDKPRAILVSAYRLSQTDTGVCTVSYQDIFAYKSIFDTPTLHFTETQLAKCQVENPLNPYTNVGLMVTHLPTGMRTAIYNPRYLEVKTLRGNNPNLHYQYLVLRKVNKVVDFLNYFPQYTHLFKTFQNHFDLYSVRLHKLYIAVYVTKMLALNNVSDKRDKYHIAKLHFTVYIPLMKRYLEDGSVGVKPRITVGKVRQYLDNENVFVPF